MLLLGFAKLLLLWDARCVQAVPQVGNKPFPIGSSATILFTLTVPLACTDINNMKLIIAAIM